MLLFDQVSLIVVTFLLSHTCLVHGQCQANTDPSCAVGVYWDGEGVSEYYDPSDTDDVAIQIQSGGTCDPGSCATVQFSGPPSIGIVSCGTVPLDGNIQLADCIGLSRGSSPDGTYQFQISGYDPDGYGYGDIPIVHSQITSTAATPTQTIETTPTSTMYETTTTTATDTVTSVQATVTIPAATASNIVTTTAPRVTVSSAHTRTFSRTVKSFTVTQTTVTKTLSCVKPTPKPCQATKSVRSRRLRDYTLPKNRLVRRQPNQGEGIYGDGPPTVTVTPDPVFSTQTDAPTTTTYTITTSAPDSTTTVPALPPTVTVASGTAILTTTLPAKTRTKTSYTYTLVVTTTTKTITYTAITKVTPTCSVGGN